MLQTADLLMAVVFNSFFMLPDFICCFWNIIFSVSTCCFRINPIELIEPYFQVNIHGWNGKPGAHGFSMDYKSQQSWPLAMLVGIDGNCNPWTSGVSQVSHPCKWALGNLQWMVRLNLSHTVTYWYDRRIHKLIPKRQMKDLISIKYDTLNSKEGGKLF